MNREEFYIKFWQAGEAKKLSGCEYFKKCKNILDQDNLILPKSRGDITRAYFAYLEELYKQNKIPLFLKKKPRP